MKISTDPQVMALINQALNCPDEDGPFLVLADYLEEQGDRRADGLRKYVRLRRDAQQYDFAKHAVRGSRRNLDGWPISTQRRCACLAIRALSGYGGRTAWDLLKPTCRTSVVAAELHALHALPTGRLLDEWDACMELYRAAGWDIRSPNGCALWAAIAVLDEGFRKLGNALPEALDWIERAIAVDPHHRDLFVDWFIRQLRRLS